MPLSMTGFGAGAAESDDGGQLSVEVRTVNHRFLDVKARLPRELGALEQRVAARVRARLDRGSVEVSVRRAGGASAVPAVRLDLELAKSYADRLETLADGLRLADRRPPSLMEMAQLPGVLGLEEAQVDLEEAERLVSEALDRALDEVVAMRRREGEALSADLRSRVGRLRELVETVRSALPDLLAAWHARLETRVASLAGDVDVDPQRLAAEVALVAERSDVAEELTRLDSHLDQLEDLLQTEGPVGRKLDFLIQEMNREANTIGSKVQSAEIAQRVVDMKGELERLREQVQNVE